VSLANDRSRVMQKTKIGWATHSALSWPTLVQEAHPFEEHSSVLRHLWKQGSPWPRPAFDRKLYDALSLFTFDLQVGQQGLTQKLCSSAVKANRPLWLPSRIPLQRRMVVEFQSTRLQFTSQPQENTLMGHPDEEHGVLVLLPRPNERYAQAAIPVHKPSDVSPLFTSKETDWVSGLCRFLHCLQSLVSLSVIGLFRCNTSLAVHTDIIAS